MIDEVREDFLGFMCYTFDVSYDWLIIICMSYLMLKYARV